MMPSYYPVLAVPDNLCSSLAVPYLSLADRTHFIRSDSGMFHVKHHLSAEQTVDWKVRIFGALNLDDIGVTEHFSV